MKRYKVTGAQPVLDKEPGETFDAALPEDQEQFLIQIGAIRIVSNEPGSDKRLAKNKSRASSKRKPVEQPSPPTLPEDQEKG